MAAAEPVQKYFDALLASYDVLVDAMEKAGERGTKVSRQLSADVVKGQREAIELGRTLATEPGEPGKFYTAILEATTGAQGRAMAFAQVAYQEALAAGTDARDTLQKLVESNRETARLAMEAARSFTSANPFADAVQKNFEAFQASMNGRTAASARTEKKASA